MIGNIQIQYPRDRQRMQIQGTGTAPEEPEQNKDQEEFFHSKIPWTHSPGASKLPSMWQ